jgi:ABC-type nitrate/sulfonate/bicarbonate transport system permease component
MFWPVVFTLLGAYKQLRPDLLEAARVYGARGEKLLRFVLMPLLFPAVVTGSIVAWGEAWETIIAAEIIINLPGVGSYLSSSRDGYFWTVGILTLLALLFIVNKYVWLPLLNMSTRFQTD